MHGQYQKITSYYLQKCRSSTAQIIKCPVFVSVRLMVGLLFRSALPSQSRNLINVQPSSRNIKQSYTLVLTPCQKTKKHSVVESNWTLTYSFPCVMCYLTMYTWNFEVKLIRYIFILFLFVCVISPLEFLSLIFPVFLFWMSRLFNYSIAPFSLCKEQTVAKKKKADK